ncbi:MAG: type II toxin-antitoxin system RelB/DinJ family antitoxin [Proteobacteria bacterium]|uniref:Type II toxin-antitoxin system RelB/DinJ family antitoxin n=1 Tax=Candidatus Avisuccinivibrio stercorigallinarum TaxID=2840704 RepID=A0A9D9GS44_9GAMM|nr:type II toxin-antitoxin system RelB/DinJ family antitoxin [Candidatus Avisuccinivibrio stercorigallinarum]
MENNSSLQIKIDKELLRQAREICSEMGLDLPTAVRMFICQLVRERGLPFTPSAAPREEELFYSPQNLAHIYKGLQDIQEGRGITKTLEELQAMEQQGGAEKQPDEA